jgi:phosphoribosylaminoimidazolecarboxamide formyltransferase/IMP cyclohydrolase
VIRLRRALVSVHDKTGLLDLARALAAARVEIVSTGGTARVLAESGVAVVPVQQVTGFPETLGGRIKTLHPLVHGGILFRRDDATHVRQCEELGIEAIDLVAVNLYPFEATVSATEVTPAEAVEQIDIGGPAMIRSAAKNHDHVVVVTDPADYGAIIQELAQRDGVTTETAARLAAKAFARTSAYDAAIAAWLSARQEGPAAEPDRMTLTGALVSSMRYGENPHQAAAAYVVPGERGGVLQARVIQGKELSYNNIVDLDAAWTLVRDLRPPACAVIKHASPCGAAEAPTLLMAYEHAHACDALSAFGGVFAFNGTLDAATAAAMSEHFIECVIAPRFEPEALAILTSRKNVRVLEGELPPARRAGREWRRVTGGFLVQDWDDARLDPTLVIVTKRQPSPDELRAMQFAWSVVKHVKSNAILFAAPGRTLAIGAGQSSRVDSVDVAVSKARRAGLSLQGSAVASDAFFPFRDGVDVLASAGASAVIQPGGSKRDEEVIEAADEHGIAMAFTGRRHFRH